MYKDKITKKKKPNKKSIIRCVHFMDIRYGFKFILCICLKIYFKNLTLYTIHILINYFTSHFTLVMRT